MIKLLKIATASFIATLLILVVVDELTAYASEFSSSGSKAIIKKWNNKKSSRRPLGDHYYPTRTNMAYLDCDTYQNKNHIKCKKKRIE